MSKRVVGQGRTLSVRQEHELLCQLESAGMTEEDAQAVIQSRGNKLAKTVLGVIRGTLVGAGKDFWAKLAHDEALFRKVVEFVACDGNVGGSATAVHPTPAMAMSGSQSTARVIMGRNFLGVEEMARQYKVTPTKEELRALESVPFSEEKMIACAKTHVLVADFGLSIMDVWEQHGELFYSKVDPWYGRPMEKKWARKRVKAQWRLLRKTAAPNSFNKYFAEQEALLDTGEKAPEARETVYMVIGHYLATGERLLSRYYARTKSVSGAGRRIYMGSFDAYGLYIHNGDDIPGNDFGLASSVKAPC